MDQAILDLKSTTFFGKRFTRKQIAEIQRTVKMFPGLSRRELAHTICEHYDWFTPAGLNRVHACVTTLEEMEEHNIITLPAKDTSKVRSQKEIIFTQLTEEPSSIDGTLDALMPLSLQVVTEKEEAKLWNEFVERYHYLGYKRPFGPHLRYFILDKDGRKLGCFLFSNATRSLVCRDQMIGWDTKTREKHLQFIINNNRFLIFPWVNVKCLASKALSLVTKQIAKDWDEHYNYQPVLLETFVDPEKYKGTCYLAANWQHIGKSQGRKSTKQSDSKSKKDTYIYPLRRDFQSVLINGEKPSRSTKPRTSKAVKKRRKLTSDDPFIQLWQEIIGIVGMVADDFDRQWQKRKRVLNTMLLILFIFRLVFSKNKQGYGITISELWDQCRTMNVPLPQPKPVAASALCNARAKLDASIFKTLNAEIIAAYGAMCPDYHWHQHKIFAVDGTKMNLPRQLLAEGYSTPSDNAYYPQGLVSCLYQLKTQIPIDFDIVAHKNERTMALTHLKVLSENDIVVYDRGYYSYEMLYYHALRGIHGIFRLKEKTNKDIDQFIASDETERDITIQPSKKTQNDFHSKHPEMKITSLELRLIKYTHSGTTYILGTTLKDREKYKAEVFGNIYHSRWGIEELYKISKVLINIEDFHGQSERGVKQELFAHFVLITLSRIFSNQIEDDFRQEEQIKGGDKFKANVKHCLVMIARNLECLFLKQVKLVKKTINTILNSMSSSRQRARPNRSYERRSRKPIQKWRPQKMKKASQAEPVAG